jgi:hypothetical protein
MVIFLLTSTCTTFPHDFLVVYDNINNYDGRHCVREQQYDPALVITVLVKLCQSSFHEGAQATPNKPDARG